MKRKLIMTTICLLGLITPMCGQKKVTVQRMTSEVNFDGRMNDKVWDELPRLDMTQNQPTFGIATSEESDVRIGYDNNYIWIGARLYMKDISKIRSTTKKRDDLPSNSDAFGVQFDSFNDNENGLAFYTTPAGSRYDATISGDAATGGKRLGGVWTNNWENKTWNTFWDVKTSKDSKGWYVEMRIPFSSMKFKPNAENVTTMGLIVTRVISSRNEKDTWPAISSKYGNAAVYKSSQAGDITVKDAKPSSPIYVTPYITAGRTDLYQQNSVKTGYDKSHKWNWDIGGDVKYAINSKMTLDVTVNPDFAQVEADDQEVNLTRYSLFLAEKRQFFQERSSLFDFSLDGSASNLFYSRNIGLNSAGEAVRIFGGARLTGKIGKWDLGFMDMQTEKTGETASENFGVLRMRRNVINPYSYVGGIFTTRMGADGHQNYAYGLDGTFKMFGDDYLDVKLASNYDNRSESKFDKSAYGYLQWERRSEKGLGYIFKYYYLGEQFNPGIGYLQRTAMDLKQVRLKYGWLPGRESKWFSYGTYLDFQRYDRLTDHKLEAETITWDWAMNSKKGYTLSLDLTYEKEGVNNQYVVSSKENIYVPAGNYDFFYGKVIVSTPKTKPYKIEAGFKYGGYYDGNQIQLTLAPVISFSQSLQMTLNYEYNRISFSNRNMLTNLHNIGAKFTYMLNTKLSADLYTQYACKTDQLTTNFRIRYNPKEGSDFYLVINDGRNFNKFKDSAGLSYPTYNSSTVMFKYTYTFRL